MAINIYTVLHIGLKHCRHNSLDSPKYHVDRSTTFLNSVTENPLQLGTPRLYYEDIGTHFPSGTPTWTEIPSGKCRHGVFQLGNIASCPHPFLIIIHCSGYSWKLCSLSRGKQIDRKGTK
jgi:hypothetical protein